MGGDSDLRGVLRLLQVCGLAPYSVGRDREGSRRSWALHAYNLAFASFVMYNMIWAENDSRNNVDYPNKSFLIRIAFDTVDVLDNVHLCLVSLTSLVFTNVGIEVWFKMKYINQKLRDLNVRFDDRKFKKLLYLQAVVFVLLSFLFLTADIILCGRLNIYYTANYWVVCCVPLLQNSIAEVSFGGFTFMLYQRLWVVNEFLDRAADAHKETWQRQQKNLSSGDKVLERIEPGQKTNQRCYRIPVAILKRGRVGPRERKSAPKKPPPFLMLKSDECFVRSFNAALIRSLKILHFDLFEVACDLNLIFGWSLLFIFATSFFGCTINMYYVIIFHITSYATEQYISSLFWMSVYLFKVLYLITSSNRTSKEACRTTELLHVLLSHTDVNDTPLQRELRAFCLQNNQCKVKFRAADFFTLDRSLLFQFIAGVLSNVVFVVQFDKINFSK